MPRIAGGVVDHCQIGSKRRIGCSVENGGDVVEAVPLLTRSRSENRTRAPGEWD
ncbi:hypothetical protein [Rhodococcus sp. P1Y]|uniref:hypothetical protein n=1 Tax=Rhodococcus sp. P1Y TaxID=1302308 RepID=UPI001F431E88|nr:hypothetical protein [Rhodococcus sp. P1Y]